MYSKVFQTCSSELLAPDPFGLADDGPNRVYKDLEEGKVAGRIVLDMSK